MERKSQDVQRLKEKKKKKGFAVKTYRARSQKRCGNVFTPDKNKHPRRGEVGQREVRSERKNGPKILVTQNLDDGFAVRGKRKEAGIYILRSHKDRTVLVRVECGGPEGGGAQLTLCETKNNDRAQLTTSRRDIQGGRGIV